MSDRATGDQATNAGSGVPGARGQSAFEDRRQRIDALRAKKKRSERIRSTAIALVIVLGTGAFFAKPAYNWVDKKLNDPLKRSVASFGVPLADAGCGKVTQDKSSGNQDHVQVGIRVEYEFVPPSSGKHYSNPVAFIARPFFTTKDNPPVENVVHNMEHGYTILWYDETAADDESTIAELKAIADRLNDSDTNNRLSFKAVPWTSEDGADFPDGQHIAFTHWSAGEEDKSSGVWQYCSEPSGEALEEFMQEYPYFDAPEPIGGYAG